MAKQKQEKEEVIDKITENQEEIQSQEEPVKFSSFIPEKVLNAASQMNRSFLKPLLGDQIKKERIETVMGTVGNLLDRRCNIHYL